MTTICVVTSGHRVHDSRIYYRQCLPLVQAGYKVTLLAPCKQDSVSDGVYVRGFKASTKRWFKSFDAFRLLGKMFRIRADVYQIIETQLIPAGLAVKLLLHGRRLIYDVHEHMPSYVMMKTYLPRPLRPLIKWAVEILEFLAAKTFDGFVFADPGTASELHAEEGRKHILYNMPWLSMFPENSIPWRHRQYDVAFLGTMTETSGTTVLLRAFSELKKQGRPFRALFIGQPRIENFKATRKQLDLEDVVEVTGMVDYSRVPKLLMDCKIGLIGLLDCPKFYKNISQKMFEYFASSIPVVCSDLPPERAFMQDGVHGRLVKPGDAHAFAQAIAELLDDPQRSAAIAAAVRQHLVKNQYCAENETAKFVAFYDRILGDAS